MTRLYVEHGVREYRGLAELYEACTTDAHADCPAGRANAVPTGGRCDCGCHALVAPV